MNPKWRTSSFWQWNLVIKEFIQNPHPKKWKFKTRLKRPFSGTFLLTNFPTPSSASRRSFLWQPQRAKTVQDWELKIGTGKQREDHNIPAQISKRSMLASNRLFVCGFVTDLEHVGATVILVSLRCSISRWPKPCQGPTQPCSLCFQPIFCVGRLPTTTCGTSWPWLSPWPPWLAFCMWRSVQQLMLVSVPWMSGD